ncbi:MAG: HGGxSTG domain-containing protein [Rugosibacter sp.]|nr:HGGxSTG domain-containing protein [Rugosibacter sp.]
MDAEQLTHLRALLRAKMKRHQRLQEMIDLLGDDGVVELVADMADKHGDDRAIDRFRLPLLATKALLAGKPYIPPVIILCGARTRTGAPCKRRPIPGKQRCRNHGGLNRGDRTPQGRINAGKGLRQWHAARRAAKTALTGV